MSSGGSSSSGAGASAAAAAAEAAALHAEKLRIAAVVAFYFVISIALVFVNKLLLDPKSSIDAPLFTTWFQCVLTVFICWACGEAGKRASPDSFFRQFPAFEYKLEVARKLLPLSVVFVGMITFNNLCLKYVEVSFYNVARSLTIVFNVVLTYYFLGDKTSSRTLLCLGVVIVGFFVGSGSEVNFSFVGTVFGVISSAFVSMNAIQTKKAMPVVDNNQWSLCAYNNMNAVIMFLPFILVTGEHNVIAESWDLLTSGYYWFIMVLGGLFGFLIGIATIMQIKVTSPLTHNISGTAKSCVQTILALVIWRNATNFANMLGVFMVLFGSSAYSWVRGQEMAEAAKQKKAASSPAPATGSGSAPGVTTIATAGGASAGSSGGSDGGKTFVASSGGAGPAGGSMGQSAGGDEDDELLNELETVPLQRANGSSGGR